MGLLDTAKTVVIALRLAIPERSILFRSRGCYLIDVLSRNCFYLNEISGCPGSAILEGISLSWIISLLTHPTDAAI